ncbi:outer membrane protein assembly factor BamB family protein [Haloarcula sp. CGMCC 1.2071]|uniref:outer membrane protein assembly factor BamB family protein n=1 Tax=Haloarcula sp. CGMCC 1.2071 TaxID=3111454 RepID=UPI00300ED277
MGENPNQTRTPPPSTESQSETTTFESGPPQVTETWNMDRRGFEVVIENEQAYISNLSSLYAVNTRTGGVQWETELDTLLWGDNITLSDDVLYLSSTQADDSDTGAKLYALSAESGDILWEYESDNEELGPHPMVIDSTIIICGQKQGGSFDQSTPYTVYCVNKENGELEWKTESTGGHVDSLYSLDGKIIVNSTDDRVFDHESGELDTESPLSDTIKRVDYFLDDFGYTLPSDGNIIMKKRRLPTGEIEWGTDVISYEKDRYNPINRLYKSNQLYIVGKNNIWSVDNETGEINWKTNIKPSLLSDLVYTQDHIWSSYEGTNELVAINKKSGNKYDIGNVNEEPIHLGTTDTSVIVANEESGVRRLDLS